MPRDFHRSRRIEDQNQRILSEIIRVDVRDPRLNGAVITAVDVTRDLSVAKIYFTSLDPAENGIELQSAFKSAMKFIRGQLARQLTVRAVPELRFQYDDSAQRGDAMDRLIEQARAKDANGGNEPETDAD
jgi:ribosome-binding factor A